MKRHILVIDDDDTLRETIAEVLEDDGYQVTAVAEGGIGLQAAREAAFDLILLDLCLPDYHGLELLPLLLEEDDRTPVVVITAFPEVRTAIAALKTGAYDYLNKPFELDDLKCLVTRALETSSLRTEVERLQATPPRQPGTIRGLVGNSPAFMDMVEVTRRIAGACKVPVLIRGESGSGKEQIAQAIHELSPRSNGPWITLNCSAISEGLLESEMFGHERGAFTDAKQSKPGLLELASGGTLFLDEVGDLAPALQPKLLRALETQCFRRVGGRKEIEVDVRFVAATNRNLEDMVAKGTFREDLFYRLNVASIEVPPLRDRVQDIVPLAHHCLKAAATSLGLPLIGLSSDAMEQLRGYAWPGNVRELRNVMERALILCRDSEITGNCLPVELNKRGMEFTGTDNDTGLSLNEIERRHLVRVLTACDGNKSEAARRLDITRVTLRAKLRRHGLEDSCCV
ncbi:sigma-54-dependent transcriptional regulator [Halomonas alkalisoli]|uniref:sigma-54-dependent transcriptional regulator n=1 Tax=Halomonas alkalisoli TaxID=2907158 RepID=UPI001F31A047|nr:sigma-54 dependent transcriptional regulator [Halomonas alkalisoli]MCE9682502.1 sigma-54 dependent transcriptional regulator [Halomonas alkalisoli]